MLLRGSEEEIEAPLQPLRMYFPHSEYTKKIKLATRCYIFEALKTLNGLEYPLSTFERRWFEEHPQFKHIFHMPMERNHKVMGMWMLLLRTACIEKEKEAWFIVNGTPIRYGIKEHALISGLNCRNYPLNYSKVGSEAFVKRHFKGQTIRYQDVKTKLEEMVPMDRSRDRLKMAVLFFLSSIVIAQTKTGADASPVEPFFLRAVDDLNFCKTFPWGRLSFDHMLREIKHTMNHFNGTVKGTLWPIPGFCIPMELLAFEAIPELGNKFLEDYPGAAENCPRMCKKRFRKSESKGFPLSKIYKELGTTVDIDSILPVRDEENFLMAEIIQEEDDDDMHDVVVGSWMQCIRKGVTITLDEMYTQDVATRVEEEPQDAVNEEIAAANERPAIERMGDPTLGELADVINRMGLQMSKILDKVDGLEKRLGSLEASVNELQKKVRFCKSW
ncbi:hypothetical protein V5N11_005400 [Cardamine amara subsp. amara]|uniref:DUF1985 domain-containing protein n=1 Tax=Cardamine amara subsp. amara TaxID=228776 RepID=A0ABD0ZVL8_CARAN